MLALQVYFGIFKLRVFETDVNRRNSTSAANNLNLNLLDSQFYLQLLYTCICYCNKLFVSASGCRRDGSQARRVAAVTAEFTNFAANLEGHNSEFLDELVAVVSICFAHSNLI